MDADEHNSKITMWLREREKKTLNGECNKYSRVDRDELVEVNLIFVEFSDWK